MLAQMTTFFHKISILLLLIKTKWLYLHKVIIKLIKNRRKA